MTISSITTHLQPQHGLAEQPGGMSEEQLGYGRRRGEAEQQPGPVRPHINPKFSPKRPPAARVHINPNFKNTSAVMALESQVWLPNRDAR